MRGRKNNWLAICDNVRTILNQWNCKRECVGWHCLSAYDHLPKFSIDINSKQCWRTKKQSGLVCVFSIIGKSLEISHMDCIYTICLTWQLPYSIEWIQPKTQRKIQESCKCCRIIKNIVAYSFSYASASLSCSKFLRIVSIRNVQNWNLSCWRKLSDMLKPHTIWNQLNSRIYRFWHSSKTQAKSDSIPVERMAYKTHVWYVVHMWSIYHTTHIGNDQCLEDTQKTSIRDFVGCGCIFDLAADVNVKLQTLVATCLQ